MSAAEFASHFTDGASVVAFLVGALLLGWLAGGITVVLTAFRRRS